MFDLCLGPSLNRREQAAGEYGKSVFPNAPPLALAIGVVWLVSLVQLTGVRHSSTFQLIATVLKVVLIVAFLVCGQSPAQCKQVTSGRSIVFLRKRCRQTKRGRSFSL